MADEPTVRELSQKVDRLEEEQKRQKQDQNADGQKSEGQPGQQKAENKPPQSQKTPEKPKKPFAQRVRRYLRRHPGRVLLGAAAFVVLIVGGALLWNYLSSYESTDDAQVDGHLNMISPRIAGLRSRAATG